MQRHLKLAYAKIEDKEAAMIKGRDLVSGLPKQEKIPIQIVEEKGPQSGQRHLCAGKSSVRKHYARTCIRYYESGNLCIWRRGSISKDGRVDQRRI